MTDYPEHSKLKGLGGANQIVGDFIEWLGENGYTICEFNPQRFCGEGEFFMTRHSRDTILSKFFEIDTDKLEAEKVAMLDELRAMRDA